MSVAAKVMPLAATALLPILLATGCTRTYYKAMATFGKEKRDILVSRV